MDPLLVGILGILIFFVLLTVGVHIGIAMGVVGLVGLVILLGVPAAVNTVAAGGFYFVTNVDFIVLPVFVLMGLIAMYGKLTDRTFDGLRRLASGLPGGTAIATIGGQAVFGTIAGTSLITAIVFGKIACPEMRRLGYDKRLAYGVAASGGILGVLLPPSTFPVIYGLLTQESLGGLLMAGVGPGILLAFLYAALVMGMVLVKPSLAPPETTRYSFVERIVGLLMTWELTLAFGVVILGIFFGIFTVTESAGVGTLLILVIAFLRHKMDWTSLKGAFGETIAIMGMLFLLLAAAKVFGKFVVVSGLSQFVVTWILDLNPSVPVFLVALVVLYSILGMFMESLSILIITIPLLYGAVKQMGIEPMWFFAVVMISIELGLLTPPIAMNVFAVKAVAEPDVTLEDVQMGSLPFTSMVLLCTALVIMFPWIANWLPLNISPVAR